MARRCRGITETWSRQLEPVQMARCGGITETWSSQLEPVPNGKVWRNYRNMEQPVGASSKWQGVEELQKPGAASWSQFQMARCGGITETWSRQLEPVQMARCGGITETWSSQLEPVPNGKVWRNYRNLEQSAGASSKWQRSIEELQKPTAAASSKRQGHVVELKKFEVDRWNLQNYMPMVDMSESEKLKK